MRVSIILSLQLDAFWWLNYTWSIHKEPFLRGRELNAFQAKKYTEELQAGTEKIFWFIKSYLRVKYQMSFTKSSLENFAWSPPEYKVSQPL